MALVWEVAPGLDGGAIGPGTGLPASGKLPAESAAANITANANSEKAFFANGLAWTVPLPMESHSPE